MGNRSTKLYRDLSDYNIGQFSGSDLSDESIPPRVSETDYDILKNYKIIEKFEILTNYINAFRGGKIKLSQTELKRSSKYFQYLLDRLPAKVNYMALSREEADRFDYLMSLITPLHHFFRAYVPSYKPN